MHRVVLLVVRNSSSRRAAHLSARTHSQLKDEPSTSVTAPAKRFSIHEVRQQTELAIEKVSLTRGLSLNKFEKDFFIYPEYTDTDDVRNVEGFCENLRTSLENSVDARKLEKEGQLTDDAKQSLQNNAIPSIFIPSEFGGLGMNNKDISKIYEELSLDWNIFSVANTSHSISNLILLYGSEAQKQKYLPLIANGTFRTAIAVVSDSSDDSGPSGGVSEVVSGGSGVALINISGQRIIGSHNANLIAVFAHSIHHISKQHLVSCYLLDRRDLVDGETWEVKRDDTLGLRAVDIGRFQLHASLPQGAMLGEQGQGNEIASELACSSRIPLASATIGYARRLLSELATICNTTQSTKGQNSMISEDAGAQRTVTALALKVYSLESAVYYLAGLLDEGIPIVVDLENALLQRLTKDVLHSSITTTVELAGLRAADNTLNFEKNMRDVSTLLSLCNDNNDVERIAMATISSWAASSHKRVTSSLKRFFGNEKTSASLKDPKLTHYIAEHAHPSLQLACQELEFSMSRVNTVLSKMVAEQGKNLEQDYGSLEGLVTVLQNNLIMVAVIARASRSYSVGLRNADIELSWATGICTRLSRATWFELEAMSDYFGLVRLNPSLLNAGRAIFDLGGYKIESPLERNW